MGSALTGLSFKNDVRPHQQRIEFWENEVNPETIVPNDEKWRRYKLHNSGNIYKVAWMGGCVMYDIEKLIQSGSFQFWKDLP